MYSAVVFFGLLSTSCLLNVLKFRTRYGWNAYGIASLVGLSLSASYFFVLIGQVFLGQARLAVDSVDRKRFYGWLFSLIVVFVLLWSVIFFLSRGYGILSVAPAHFSVWEWLQGIFQKFWSLEYLPIDLNLTAFVIFGLIPGILGYELWVSGLSRERIALLFWLFFPVVLLALLSPCIRHDIRYLLFPACAWPLLLGAFFAVRRRSAIRVGVFTVVLCLNLLNLAYYYFLPQKPSWREIGSYAMQHARGREPMYVYPEDLVYDLSYYYKSGEVRPLRLQSDFTNREILDAGGGWIVLVWQSHGSDPGLRRWLYLIERRFGAVYHRSWRGAQLYHYESSL